MRSRRGKGKQQVMDKTQNDKIAESKDLEKHQKKDLLTFK